MNTFYDFDEPSMRTMRGDANEGTLGRIDQYEIIRKLGGGGFGVVYLVRDTQSDVEYAIKTLHPLLKSNPEEMENLRSQFKLVSKLIHSHIAPAMILHPVKEVVYATEEVRKDLRLSSGEFMMVMKYAPGVTLSNWRKQFPDGVVPVDKAIDICKQIAMALDFAHSQKIIHRDIKPSNIMIESYNGEVIARVLDFGLAAEIRSSISRVSTEKGDTSGTRPYMAPEQWQGKRQGAATDQYALACLFYELVSGAVPFAGVYETGDFNAMMYAVENRTPETLPILKSYQNKALQRALSKDMKKRFASCTEFINKLSSKSSGGSFKFLFALLLLGIIGVSAYLINDKPSSVEEPTPPPQKIEAADSTINEKPSNLAEPTIVTPVVETPAEPVDIPQPEEDVVSTTINLILPSDDATIEELVAFKAKCDSKIKELKNDNYIDTDPEIISIEELKKKAEGLLNKKYEEQEENNKRQREEIRRKQQEDKIKINRIEIIKKNVSNSYTNLDNTWTDGIFAEKRKTIQNELNKLNGYASADDLEKAQNAQIKILEEIDWINKNTASRNNIDRLIKKIDNLKGELERAEVKDLEIKLYNEAQSKKAVADKALNEGNWIDAENNFNAAYECYSKAITSAKEYKSIEAVSQAEGFKKANMWEECLKSAQAALEWNPSNSKADKLLTEANNQLKPILTVIVKKDGKQISGKNLLEISGKKYDFGESINLDEGWTYKDAVVKCKIGEKQYYGASSIGTANWKGNKKIEINLEEIKELPFITVLGIDMVRIPDSAEHKGLYFGKYEVTQAQWQAVRGDNPSYFTGDSSRPVEKVSWNDCQEFIKKLNARTEVKQAGITFRLPTEEEWEYACRAGSTGKYGLLANGREGSLDEMGWYEDNSGSKTHPVGQKEPNAWGLYDMHGNVWEWTASANGSDRISRGGGYFSLASSCESVYWFCYSPDFRYYYLGFRLVASRTVY